MELELPGIPVAGVVKAMKCLQSKTVLCSRRLAGSESGSEVFEAALVLPMLLLLLIGMFWMGRMFNIYETLTRAAREGARVAVSPSCGGCSPANSYPSADEVRNRITSALNASSLSINPNDASTGSINVIMPANSPGPVTIQISYPVTPVIPFTTLNLSKITISAQVIVQQE